MNTIGTTDQLCQVLCDLLAEGEDVHRTVAAQTLGRMGYKEAVPELIKSLLDEDEDVRTDVATALAQFDDVQAAEPLMQNLLGDPCPEVKLAAIDALTNIGHKELVPWLRRMLKGKDEDIVWDESEFFETGWDDWVDIQISVIKAIARFGDEDAVADIVEAIDDEYGQDISEIAFAAFGKLGEPGAEALAGYAASADQRLRRRAVTILGGMSGPTAAKAMNQALADDDVDVRVAGGKAIAARNAEDPRLEMLLLDRDENVRAAFVAICGKFHPARLSAMLSERFGVIQSAVLRVLIDNPDVINEKGLKGQIIEILEATEIEPAALAARALMAISPEDMEARLLEKLTDNETALEVRLGIIKGITASANEAVLDALKSVLSDDQRQIRLAAMTAIAEQSKGAEAWPNEAGDVLFAALRGEVVLPPEEPEEAEADDAETGDEASPEEAPQKVTETIEMAQSVAPVRSIEEIDKEQAAIEEKIEEAEFQEVEIDVQPGSTLAAVLDAEHQIDNAPLSEEVPVELSEEDLEYIELTKQGKTRRKVVAHDTGIAPHQDVRRYAARVLGDFAREDVSSALAETLANDDKELILTALDSLAHVGVALSGYPQDVVDTLLEMAAAQAADVRIGVTKALVQANTDETIEHMRAGLQDDNSFVRTEAIRGLKLYGKVDEQVEACLGDNTPSVRLTAAEAMAVDATRDVVLRLVDFSLDFEAFHIRAVARLLAANNADIARQLYLDVLNDTERKRYWKSAIEALEEIGRPEINAALAA